MARRVSWTNNSSGHTGTYVYRAPTLDPQNLPAPVATVDPVAQGATAEWVDNESLSAGNYDYAVQDFDGQGVGALSAVADYTAPIDYSSAIIGDEIGGGIYAGTITYADSRQFHIIVSKIDAEADAAFASNSGTNVPGCEDEYDGFANTQDIIAEGISAFPAANHCVNYVDAEGNNDYYLPAIQELEGPVQSLHSSGNFPTNSVYIWASNENPPTPDFVFQRRIIENGPTRDTYAINTAQVRPIRRVAV